MVSLVNVTSGSRSQASLATGAVNSGVAGQVIVASSPSPANAGAVVSTTVMVWLTVLLVLPQASVAHQVLVIVYVPAHAPCVVLSLDDNTGAVSHSSLAVGGVNCGVPGHDIVASAPAALKVGATLSITLTVWLTGALTLPQASVAIQVRVTEYACGQLPCVVSSVKVIEGLGSQASVAVGAVNNGAAIQ